MYQKLENILNRPINGFVFLFFLALHLYALKHTELLGFKVTFTDAVTVLMTLWLGLAWTKGWLAPLTRSEFLQVRSLLILAGLFFFWAVIKAFDSPWPHKAVSLLLILLRNYLLFAILFLAGTRLKLAALNKNLFYLGAIIILCAAPLFIWAKLHWFEIRHDRSMWSNDIGWMFGDKFIIRFLGFAGDPNFFSIFLLPMFLGGWVNRHQIKRKALFYGFVILQILAFYYAFSRTFIAAVFLATLAYGALYLLRNRVQSLPWKKLTLVGATIMGVLVLLPSEILIGRFSFLAESQRFLLWEKLFEAGKDQIWLGGGLRYTQAIIGKYSHCSYFDLIFEMGIPGLLLWLAMAFEISRKSFHQLFLRQNFPWAFTWFTVLIYMAGFSFVYHPFFWLVAGLLVTQSVRSEKPGELGSFSQVTYGNS